MTGDIITEINGNALSDSQQTIQQISGLQLEKKVSLNILRGWKKLILSVKVSQRLKFPKYNDPTPFISV